MQIERIADLDAPTSSSRITKADSPGSPIQDRGRSFFGSLFLFAGFAILLLLLADRVGGLPFKMPRSWYVDRAFWIFAGLLSVVQGWRLLSERDVNSAANHSEKSQQHVRNELLSGRRFRQVVLYSRPDCHLCENALAILEKYSDVLPPTEIIDIESDPALRERYGTCIPVIEIDGKVRFRGEIRELLLRRLIGATPPKDFETPLS